MTFKTIALIVQSQSEIPILLDFAAPYAESEAAHLIGIHAEAIPVAYSASVGFPDVAFIETSEEEAVKRAATLSDAFSQRLAASQISHEWQALRSMSGDSGASGAVLARSADLVVVVQPGSDTAGVAGASIDPIVQDSGRPVLVLPGTAAAVRSFDRVLVAWNGSREAARAVHDALPFIAKARATEVFVIDPPEDADQSGGDGALIAAALARHGATVSVTSGQADGRSIEDAIHARAAETGADLVVLGAYGSSWLKSLFVTGVAKGVVNSAPTPVLLSH